MNTYAITATIGRNIGDVPMGTSRWKTFPTDVRRILVRAATDNGANIIDVATRTGEGTWGGELEESASVTVVTNGLPNMTRIRTRLAALAARYEQDAIALAVGESELITP